MRSSGKAIGQSVGRMIFAGQSAKHIERNLMNKVGEEKLHAALSKRGITDVKAEDIAKAMTGETRGRAGWSQGKLKNVVEALQDVGVAHAEKSASHMVLQAAKNIEKPVEQPHMSENQLKARLQEMSRERREEANAEQAAAVPAEGRSVRDIREQMRKDLQLKPEIRIAKPNNPFQTGSGFQA